MRKSGILLPISSLPSNYGIGTFGKAAYDFVDFLSKSSQGFWQILPLGPTSYGDSPYQSFSSFAGNPYFIDLDILILEGLLSKEECNIYEWGSDLGYVDYEKMYQSKFAVLKKAFNNNRYVSDNEEYQVFVENNSFWLQDYALFMSIKGTYKGKEFTSWEVDLKKRRVESLSKYINKFGEEIEFYKFIQYKFFQQWKNLKKYANDKGIRIIGDIPIYVAFDSAETWSHPELFELDQDLYPVSVAGCPPDGFSKTGQLWGNPLYNWEYHKETGYEWWIKRMKFSFDIYDVVRIDHFRGLDEYYSIPYGSSTAELGEWKKGPGYDFFRIISDNIGKQMIILEDLGFLTDSVRKLVKRTKCPGMKILQFAFDSREESDYLPHNYDKNCIAYTGTHDNDTILGWWGKLSNKDKNIAKKYLDIRSTKHIHWDIIRCCMSSVAMLSIIPMQDFLGLDSSARMNIPSTVGGNWIWRMKENEISDELAEKICELTKTYFRL